MGENGNGDAKIVAKLREQAVSICASVVLTVIGALFTQNMHARSEQRTDALGSVAVSQLEFDDARDARILALEGEMKSVKRVLRRRGYAARPETVYVSPAPKPQSHGALWHLLNPFGAK